MKSIFFTIYFTLFFQVVLQSQTLDATLLELKFSNDGYPEKFTKVDNGFFFSSEDDQLWFSDGIYENTFLVKDFASGTYDDITSLTPVGTKVFFVAENGNDNRELWVSDGTEGGTIQLTDRNVGFSTESIYDIIKYNDKVYFGAYSELYGFELWVSDGTPEGTFVVKDIAPGTDKSSNPSDFFVFNDKLIFKASTDAYNMEYWTSDGTEEGTILLKDIREGNQAGAVALGQVIFNGNFYFFANNGTTGTELWKSDGTPEGTKLLKDIRTGYLGSNNSMIGAVLNDKLIFVANDGATGNELWETDGTLEGTTLFYDINNGVASGFGYNGILQLVGNKIYFTASDGTEQSGLWVSDGTNQGTTFLNSAYPEVLAGDNLGNYIVFFGYNENYESLLWKSDGTVNGTTILSDEIQVTNISVSEQGFLSYGNRIFFNGKNKVNGNELWSTDGTPGGTKLLFDVNHSYGVSPSLLTTVGNQLFFRGNKYGTYGLCTSDGTLKGTRYLNIGSNEGGIDDESEFIDFNGKLIVSAHDGVHGYELWISDGTEPGTYIIKDINLGNGSSMYNSIYVKTFAVINDKFYFMANDGIHGYELWISDGTELGTQMIKDLKTGGSNNHSYPSDFVELNGIVYFHAFSNSGDAVWKTDGTEAGTEIVANLNDIRHLRVANNKLLIIAETSGTTYGPHDLWVSDGTTQGTQHVKSFGDNIDSSIQFMTILNDELYFVAKSPVSFRKAIYKSDGTVGGTILLYDGANHNPSDIDIDDIITCGDYVYFAIQEGFGANKELWRTDGTVDGTVMVAGSDTENFLYIRNMICSNEYLLYIAESSAQNIWATNGQPNEAIQLDIQVSNGPNFQEHDNIGYMEVGGDKLYFEARNDISGSEIYVTTPNFENLSIDNFGELQADNSGKLINIYPNPSNEFINIKSIYNDQIQSFELVDLYGKRLIKKLNESLSSKMTYNLSKFSQGIYLIKVQLLDGSIDSSKIIIGN